MLKDLNRATDVADMRKEVYKRDVLINPRCKSWKPLIHHDKNCHGSDKRPLSPSRQITDFIGKPKCARLEEWNKILT